MYGNIEKTAMNMKTITCSIFLMIAFIISASVYAQPGSIRETNTPIALHYANILIQNYADQVPNDQGLFISVGITHKWK